MKSTNINIGTENMPLTAGVLKHLVNVGALVDCCTGLSYSRANLLANYSQDEAELAAEAIIDAGRFESDVDAILARYEPQHVDALYPSAQSMLDDGVDIIVIAELLQFGAMTHAFLGRMVKAGVDLVFFTDQVKDGAEVCLN